MTLPPKLSGKPCIRGLRVTVSDVLHYLASALSADDRLRDFPGLTRQDVRASPSPPTAIRDLTAIGGR